MGHFPLGSNNNLTWIGLGGGCHWCTEAVFGALKGVSDVKQGWISSEGDYAQFSEAVLLGFDSKSINLEVLLEIHLLTHSSTSPHSMRDKYRSAVYYTSSEQRTQVNEVLNYLQKGFDRPLVTVCIPFKDFRLNEEQFLNYYKKQPEAPFCQTYISPKLLLLKSKFGSKVVDQEKLTTEQE